MRVGEGGSQERRAPVSDFNLLFRAGRWRIFHITTTTNNCGEMAVAVNRDFLAETDTGVRMYDLNGVIKTRSTATSRRQDLPLPVAGILGSGKWSRCSTAYWTLLAYSIYINLMAPKGKFVPCCPYLCAYALNLPRNRSRSIFFPLDFLLYCFKEISNEPSEH